MDARLFNQYQLFRKQLNKLQATKSSFQAWKCVSLGYALLAVVLLFAKWHEVATDLTLLQGIDRMLWQPARANETALAAPALSFATFLGRPRDFAGDEQAAANRTTDRVEPIEAAGPSGAAGYDVAAAASPNSSSMALVSHMQISLASREFNGNELLRQEVETFLGEFRSAKSTLGLSLLLVLVYVVSWILMALAVNDARISNDVSLRNILLLSIFGAIDMAASCGFVMIRLIMFNVKSSAAAQEILSAAALRHAPASLTSDQLTAFTALRLVAMRSCSAYIDVYVSIVVALLTALRLYAIVRAIAYYRFLRRFNDLNRNLSHQQQLGSLLLQNQQQHQQQAGKQLQPLSLAGRGQLGALNGLVDQSGLNADLMRAQLAQQQQSLAADQDAWLAAANKPREHFQLLTSGGQQVASRVTGVQQSQADIENGQLKLASGPQQEHLASIGNAIKFGSLRPTPTHAGKLIASSKSYFGTQRSPGAGHEGRLLDSGATSLTLAKTVLNRSATRRQSYFRAPPTTFDDDIERRLQSQLEERGASAQHAHWTFKEDDDGDENGSNPAPHSSARNETAERRRWPEQTATGGRKRSNATKNDKLIAPDLLMVNGRAHRLISASTVPRLEVTEQSRNRRRALGEGAASGYESATSNAAGGPGFESEPDGGRRMRRRHESSVRRQRSRSSEAYDQLERGSGVRTNPNGFQEAANYAKQPSFTLLSAGQLERLSRKLLAGATSALAAGAEHAATLQPAGRKVEAAQQHGNKYRLVARYRPVEFDANAALERDRARRHAKASHESDGDVEDDDAEDEDEEEAEGAAVAATPPSAAAPDRLSPGRAPVAGSSSSGLATDSDDHLSQRPLVTSAKIDRASEDGEQADRKAFVKSKRQRVLSSWLDGGEAPLSSLRQTEELNIKTLAAPKRAARQGEAALIEKYYYA